MQSGEHQVTGQSRLYADFRSFEVADLADKNKIVVLAEEGAQRSGEVQAYLLFHLHLVDSTQLKLDGILRGHDVGVYGVQGGDGGIQGVGFPGTRRTGHQHHAVGFHDVAVESFQRRRFHRNIMKPYGMVLVTGPTGSGKTNTLYSSVATLNTVDTNIMTAEDPVEFQLSGINQVQMKEQIGLNFAAALRSFLRQDPNIILVGEVRDFETAEIGVKAALTGHLVLSTLHTNDAPSTISRLMNMGIEPFLVATSVNLIQAQRLIRRVCKDCKEEHQNPPEALIEVGFKAEEATKLITFKGKGCSTCNNTGYKGRIGLYEV